MSKKNKNPSMTQIRKVLMGCVFNPREPGPMQIIAQTGNKEYRAYRAIEFINSFQTSRYTDKSSYLKDAIALLALTLVELESDENANNLQSQERTRTGNPRQDNQVSPG